MAISCKPSDLLRAATCFSCLTPKGYLAARTYLLCQYAFLKTCTPPTSPDNAALSNIMQTSMTVTWTEGASPSAPVTGFLITWGTTNGASDLGSATVPSAPLSYTITGLPMSTTVFVTIFALSSGCPSKFSTGASGTTAGATDPLASDWADRVVINGDPRPTDAQILAVSNLAATLRSNNLLSKFVMLNPCVAKNNATAVVSATILTPLIKTAGIDPWTAAGNNNADFQSIDGLHNNFLNNAVVATGFNASTAFANDNGAGVHLYGSILNKGGFGGRVDWGYSRTDALAFNCAMQDTGNANKTTFNIWNNASAFDVGVSPGAGYYSFNILAGIAQIFFANSVTAHAQLGANHAIAGSRSSTLCLIGGVQNELSSVFAQANNVYSVIGVSTGLTLAEDNIVYNAFQAFRQAIGGGFV